MLPRKQYVVNWYGRKDRSKKFYAKKDSNGELALDTVSYESVMFWCMADVVGPDYFELSNYWLKRISHEYLVLDGQF